MNQYTIANCGLICSLCQPAEKCDCRSNNHCGKRLSEKGCHQYNCCKEKGYEGCWECPDAPCDKDMFANGQTKIRAFIRAIKEDGMSRFQEYIHGNEARGVVYHRSGIHGDYDLDTEEEVLRLLRDGKRD